VWAHTGGADALFRLTGWPTLSDLESAVSAAIALGAVEAAHQPAPDQWRVLLDPVGHPFC